jgi:hypothetical protein
MQRFAAVQAERDALYDKFEASVYEVAQKTGAQQRTCKGLGCLQGQSNIHCSCADRTCAAAWLVLMARRLKEHAA